MSKHRALSAFIYGFAGVVFLLLLVWTSLCHSGSLSKEYVSSTSLHDAYSVYQTVDALSIDSAKVLSLFLPSEAADIWISHDSGFGYEDWQVSCIVPGECFNKFIAARPYITTSAVDVFGFDVNSYKMCVFFYRKRLGISVEEIGNIRTRDRFLECYAYDKNGRWHLTYCYDHMSKVLTCDFGR